MWPYTEWETLFLDPAHPRGELAARTLAMPADANPSGDIFGGWIMSMMDSAGAITATRRAEGRVVTASVSNISFLHPVNVGDVVCCYTDVLKVGRSSIKLAVEIWVLRQGRGARLKVTAAEFTFVAIDEAGRPRAIGAARATPEIAPAPTAQPAA
ncbi:MAG TPA: acyl-CoA thioesterase [Stellaceae bacterium]|jgi:acyl-CoA thioesterase YciA|nr:acyl-CoA thioesterase [Stellaceae bacterium]